jgi:hypothetical protein
LLCMLFRVFGMVCMCMCVMRKWFRGGVTAAGVQGVFLKQRPVHHWRRQLRQTRGVDHLLSISDDKAVSHGHVCVVWHVVCLEAVCVCVVCDCWSVHHYCCMWQGQGGCPRPLEGRSR